MCGPASIVAELERTVYTVSYVFNYAKTVVKFLSACRPLLCMEINVRARREIKLYRNLNQQNSALAMMKL